MPNPNALPRQRMTPSEIMAARQREETLEGLIDRLPAGLPARIRWLRRPSSRWVRLPSGILLIGGSLLSVLPFFGLWMLPLGLVLLAEDIPPLRRARDRLLDRIARRRAREAAAIQSRISRSTHNDRMVER